MEGLFMHSFDKDLAVKLGVDEAIILQNLVFWISKNKANNRHKYDNKYWTYNSYKAFSELFPYWTLDQIRGRLKSLQDKGVIIVGNYSKGNYSRTKYYTLSDEYQYLINDEQKRVVELPEESGENPKRGVVKIPKGGGENPRTITDNKTTYINNTDIPPISPKGDLVDIPNFIDGEVWTEWIQHRKEIRKALKPTQSKAQIKKLTKWHEQGHDVNQIINQSITNGWAGLFELKENQNGKTTKQQQISDQARELLADGF